MNSDYQIEFRAFRKQKVNYINGCLRTKHIQGGTSDMQIDQFSSSDSIIRNYQITQSNTTNIYFPHVLIFLE